jgi:hypothetical protein
MPLIIYWYPFTAGPSDKGTEEHATPLPNRLSVPWNVPRRKHMISFTLTAHCNGLLLAWYYVMLAKVCLNTMHTVLLRGMKFILVWLLMPSCSGKKKRDELNIKSRKIYWLLGRNSELSVHNKLTLYKQVIRPVWSYGIQLWGCASDSNIQVIQRYGNKVLKCIVNAPWYVRNIDLHRDLGI